MISPEIFIEGVAQNACESLADVILIELLDSHYRSVILAREPTAAFALFGTAEIAGVATRVSQARPRLRLGRGVSKLPLCTRLARRKRTKAACPINLPIWWEV